MQWLHWLSKVLLVHSGGIVPRAREWRQRPLSVAVAVRFFVAHPPSALFRVWARAATERQQMHTPVLRHPGRWPRISLGAPTEGRTRSRALLP